MKSTNNYVILKGRAGRDPNIITLPNGSVVAKFSLATVDYYTNAQGEKIRTTHWHKIVAYGKLARQASQALKKGISLSVEGKITHRTYSDKAGITRQVTEIIALKLVLPQANNTGAMVL